MPELTQIMNSLPDRFRTEKAGTFKGEFLFIFSGSSTRKFQISIANKTCKVIEIDEKSNQLNSINFDCTIRSSGQTYVDVETGKLQPQIALMTQQLKVDNLPLIMQFVQLFRSFKLESNNPKISASNPLNSQLQSVQVELRKPKEGPLNGIRILDLSRLLPGPLATMHLADLGAEVIKIEDPESPDPIRSFPPFVNGFSSGYLATNRSKRSLSLNLHSDQGKEIFFKLIKTADIVIEQYRPGVLNKKGIGYNTALKYNPKIIYVSITGYGQNGPYSQKAGHDINYISYAGILGLCGTSNQISVPGIQMADIAAGAYQAVNACSLALLKRNNTGQGEHVDVSMFDGSLPLVSLPFADYQFSKKEWKAGEFMLGGSLGNYNTYRCRDGRWIALGALEPKFWKSFCVAVERPEWQNRMLGNKEEQELLISDVQALFLSKSQNDWLNLLEKHDCCVSPVLGLSELSNNPHILARNSIKTYHHETYGKIDTISQPLRFKNTALNDGWAPPALGEDTFSILEELGIDPEPLLDSGLIN